MTSTAFGLRLREMRTAKGLSLSEFARRLYYSKGHVSRIETGAQSPSAEFARRCDVELDAGGELADLVPTIAPNGPSQPDHDYDDEVWMMTMAPDGSTRFVPLGRRDVLLGGAAMLAGLGTMPTARPPVSHGGALAYHQELLNAARELGQVASPGSVLPMLVGQAQSLRTLARNASGRDAADIAALSARTAEFAGWMAQESGDDASAAWWIGKAVQVAAEAGDHHTATYALVRRALITLNQGDAAATVEFARQAQSASGTPPRILGLAAQREAQGHALAGDYDQCMRALDRAARQLETARAEATDGPVLGTSHVSDPASVVTGWCLYDLGRPQQAAEVLDREVARIPAEAVRARLRFGVRQALAHAAAGHLDQACALAQPMLGQATSVGSATILADVRRLATTLRRWNSYPAVRALDPAFAAALYRGL